MSFMAPRTATRPATRTDLPHPEPAPPPPPPASPRTLNQRPATAALVWVALACGFVLLGGGNLDLGPRAARLGMAASEGSGPLGQVLGGWDPALWPGRVAVAQVWAWGEGGRATAASIRWPEAIAVLAIGLVLSLRMSSALGRRAGLLAALALFGGLGAIHRAEGTGADWIAGLAVVAALDRLIAGRGDGWLAGFWTALALAAGGWPPVALIGLALIAVGRPVSWRLVVPAALAFAAWSAWTIRVASPQAWGAAIALPLKAGPSWWLVPGTIALALPWFPAALLGALPSVRNAWTDPARGVLLGWAQAAGAAALAGTLVPGLAPTARVVLLAGLVLTTAAALEVVLFSSANRRAARTWVGLALGVGLLGGLALLALGGYLAAAVSYYRQAALVLCLVGLAVPAAVLAAAVKGRPRLAFAAVVVLAAALKLAHYSVYVPEWNYRMSQGPWGRAIGQWVPPNWPLYVVHTWPDDLLFHIERPARQLAGPPVLAFKPKDRPHHVLLLEAEFTHWPPDAPPLVKVRDFVDQHGTVRVLARTEGDLDLR